MELPILQKYVKNIIPKYSLTKGINEKKYRLISDQVIDNLPEVKDWFEHQFLKENNFLKAQREFFIFLQIYIYILYFLMDLFGLQLEWMRL